jgi:uncharacterized protein (TIGR02145 family)
LKVIVCTVLFCLVISHCANSQQGETVTIGTQVWATKNLNVDRFRNGDLIPQVKTEEEWKLAGENKQPAWCFYNNEAANGTTYGKLYNWYAVMDPRGLAPKGWHVPSDNDWTLLTDYTGDNAGEKLMAASLWSDNGKYVFGFTGLLGGFRNFDGTFLHIGNYGEWWSSSEDTSVFAWVRFLNNNSKDAYKHSLNKRDGLSVRCLKD